MLRWLIIGAFLCSGCGGEPWSPLGTFELVMVWRGGNCNQLTPRAITLTVSAKGDSESDFFLAVSELGAEVEGNVLLTNDDCTMSFSLIEPNGTGIGFLGTAVSMFNITEIDGDIEGAGMLSVGSPDNCSQVFTVEGMKAGPN